MDENRQKLTEPDRNQQKRTSLSKFRGRKENLSKQFNGLPNFSYSIILVIFTDKKV